MPEPEGFIPDLALIAAAAELVAGAEQAVRTREAAVAAAEDAEADASGAVDVAEAKADDFAGDETKKAWQVTAAQSDLAKKKRAHARAAAQLAAAKAALDVAVEDLAQAHADFDQARRTPAAPDASDELELMVSMVPLTEAPPALVQWVEGTLQDRLTGRGKEGRWCVKWTEHPDAVHRLAAMYDEYQFLLLQGKGAPSLHMFIREVLDYHMPFLTSPETGVFRECNDYGHEPHRRVDSDAVSSSASGMPN